MRFSIRGSKVQATLVFFEIAVIPVAVLLTFFVLLGGAGTAAAVRTLGEVAGLGEGAVATLVDATVVVAAVVLVSLGALAVDGYRLYFDRNVRDPRPLPMVVVPLVGAIGAFVYGVTHFGVTEIPWWLFVVVAVSANAVAFRLITVYSFLYRSPRTGYLAGALAAVPAVVGLTRFADANLLEGASDEVSRSILAALATTPIPEQRWLLVVVPLLVAGVYGARQTLGDSGDSTLDRTSGSDQPSVSTSLTTSIRDGVSERIPGVPPKSFGNTVSGVVPSVSRPRPMVRIRKLTRRSTKASVGSVDAAGSLGAATAGRSAPPPQSGRAKRTSQVSASRSPSPASTIEQSGESASDEANVRTDRSAASDVSRASDGWDRSKTGTPDSGGRTDHSRKSTSSSGSAVVSSDGSADDTSAESSTGQTTGSSTDSNADSTSGSNADTTSGSNADSTSASTTESPSGSNADSTGASTTESPSASTTESTSGSNQSSNAGSEASESGSDTRIFTDDFGTYGVSASPVEVCPDCEKDIPSDGVYKFCPFCGSGL